jgi:hypothetical protein
MAEIRIERERKRGLGWLWALLLVLVIAGVAWYLWTNGYFGGATTGRTDTTRTSLTTGRMLLGTVLAMRPAAWSLAA